MISVGFRSLVAIAVCSFFSAPFASATDYYWRTDDTPGSFDLGNWSVTSATSTGGTSFPSDTLNNAIFTANSLVNGPTNTTNVGSITVQNGAIVTFPNVTGNSILGGGVVHTIDVNGVLDLNNAPVGGGGGDGYIKNGAGIFETAGNSAAKGGFTLNSGTVIMGGINALGSGVLNINGGAITANATRAVTAKYSKVNVGGNFVLGGVTTTASITDNASASASISFVDAFDLGSASRTITIGTGATGVYTPGPLTSSTSGVGLTVNGTTGSTFAFGYATNTYTGPTNLSGGSFTFVTSSGVNSFANTSQINISGTGTLTWGSGQLDDLSAKLSAGSGIASGAVATFFIPSSTSVQFTTGLTGAGGIQQGGSGKLILSANNAYQGSTSIAGAGTLQVGANGKAGSLGSNTGPITFTGAGGHLVFNRSDRVTIANQLTGDGSLWQAGSGTLVLTATNSNYQRGTTVQGGALLLENASGSATGSGSITVSNTTLLGGAGVSASAFTLNAGGKIAPGAGGTTGTAASIGVLTLGDGTFSAGSNYQIEINATSTSSVVADQIVMGVFTGDSTGQANLVLSRIDSLGQLAYGTSFIIIKTSTDLRSMSDPKAATKLATFFNLPTDSAGTQYAISETPDANSGVFDIVLTGNNTPELGSISLFGTAAAALTLSRRRHLDSGVA